MTKTKAIIVGTASSWKKTPWTDPEALIVTLNDAYALGLPRSDEHYELHPLDKMWFRPTHQTVVHPKDIPKGHYVRPEGHLEWLKTQAQTIPVWLQKEPPADWPSNAARLPIEQIEAVFGGDYWTSGPAYEIAHLYLRGYRHFEIYGIHLSTEQEYREQRPQFEMLIGSLLGVGYTMTRDEKKGLRIYTGKEVTVVLPVESPVMQHGWRYAYEPRPVAPPNPWMDELKRTQKQKAQLIKALVYCPVGQDKTAMLGALEDMEVIEIDCQQMLQRSQGMGTLVAQLAGA